MPRTAPPILLLVLLAASCIALRAEEPAPEAQDEKATPAQDADAAPIKLTLAIDADFVPTVTLTNVSDKPVAVVAKNPMLIRNNAPPDAYTIRFEPESKELEWSEFRPEDANKPMSTVALAPGASHILHLERLSGMSSLGEREVKVTASYRATDRHANEIGEAAAKTLWLGTIRSDSVTVSPSDHPPGIGTIANSKKWESEHSPKKLLLPFMKQTTATLRLSFAGTDPRDPNLSLFVGKRDGLPKGWCVCPTDSPIIFYLFGKTGYAYWGIRINADEVARSNQDEKNPITADYRHLGFTEEMEKQRKDPHDFEWTRNLDGAAIHYRVVEGNGMMLLIEVWEEEYEKYKSDIEKVFKQHIDLITGKTPLEDIPASQPFAPIIEEEKDVKDK